LIFRRILFYANEARKLLKTKDRHQNNSKNEPKTKLKRSWQVVETTLRLKKRTE